MVAVYGCVAEECRTPSGRGSAEKEVKVYGVCVDVWNACVAVCVCVCVWNVCELCCEVVECCGSVLGILQRATGQA